MFDIVTRGAKKFGDARCLGWRDLINVHEDLKKVKEVVDGEEREVEKKWSYFELGEYQYISFAQYEKLVLTLGAGFRKLGLKKADRVHLYAATR